MSFAEQNIANSFEFAQKLVRAKDIQEVMALQQEYLQTQMKAMSEQAKDLGSVATKAAMDSAKPKSLNNSSLYLNICRFRVWRVLCIAKFLLQCTISVVILRSSGELRQLVRAGRALTKRERTPQ